MRRATGIGITARRLIPGLINWCTQAQAPSSSADWTWDQCLSRVAAIKSLYDFKRTDAVWFPLLSSLVNLSFQPGRERKLASRGGGWAQRAQAVNELERCAGSVKEDVTCWRSSTA